MKPIRLLSLLLVNISFFATSFSQTIDELAGTVAFLSTNNQTKYGTGFFVKSDKALYLITAQHVANFLTTKSSITIRTDNDIPFTFSFSEIIKSNRLDWEYHTEGDIALLKLFPSVRIIKKLDKHFLTLSRVYSKDVSISREITITLIGFPLKLGLTGLFSPITRDTKPASGFLNFPRADTKNMATFFIIQDPSIEGFSGAPVFDLGKPIQSASKLVIRGMKPRVVGLVHGTISDKTGGKFGAIVPSHQIHELIIQSEK